MKQSLNPQKVSGPNILVNCVPSGVSRSRRMILFTLSFACEAWCYLNAISSFLLIFTTKNVVMIDSSLASTISYPTTSLEILIASNPCGNSTISPTATEAPA
jgi:hypothetical protein